MASKFSLESILTLHDNATVAMKKVENSSSSLSSHMKKQVSGMSQIWEKFHGVIVGALAAVSVHEVTKAITDFADKTAEISRMSDILGVNTTQMQKMNYVAARSEVSSEDLANAFKKMNNSLGNLATGSGNLFTYLKKANPQLAVQLMHTKDSAAAFGVLMDAIAKTTDVQKRAALTQAAFGKGGQNMIAMAENYNALVKEAENSGTLINPADIAAGAELHDTLKKLTLEGQGFLNRVLGRLVQKIAPLADKFFAWADANKEIIGQKIEKTIDFITNAATAAYNIFAKWGPVIAGVTAGIVAFTVATKVSMMIQGLAKGMVIANAAFGMLASGARISTVAQWAFNASLAASPITWIAIAIAALVVIIILCVKHWKEITKWITGAWDAIKVFAVGIWNVVIGALQSAVTWLENLWTMVKTFALGVWNTVIPYVKAFGESLLKFWLIPINLVLSGVVALMNLLGKLPGKVGEPFRNAAASVGTFKDSMNQLLTGSTGIFDFKGSIQNALSGQQGAGAPGVYASPGTATAESHSQIDKNTNNNVNLVAPAGGWSFQPVGQLPPAVTLSQGVQ